MDPSLYNAAIEGNIEVIVGQIKDQTSDHVLQLRFPNKNTILHLTSQFGQTEAVQALLSTHPSLLSEVNRNGDSALHLASRGGHTGVVRALIACAKMPDDQDVKSGRRQTWQGISRLKNNEEDTALHVAARYNGIEVVRVLLEEDPSFCALSNKSGETPLYLAASRGFHDLLDVILKAPTEQSYHGPDDRTALHGAVICNSLDCTRKLKENFFGPRIWWTDVYQRTPLDYAAHLGFANIVKELLLSVHNPAGYMANDDVKNTALFLAASAGHVFVMKELISHCPSCCDMVNAKGRNVLHIAIEHEQKNVIEYLLEECPTISSLIIEKDTDGNTPLHLLVTYNCFVPELIQHPMADKEALNNNKLTPLDLATYDDDKSSTKTAKSEIAQELKRVGAVFHLPNAPAPAPALAPIPTPIAPAPLALDEDKINSRAKKVVDNHMLVAALIATVAFTAGFTMPGGYIQSGSPNQGMAVLSTRSIAFQAFMISDTVALLFSTSALFVYFLSAIYAIRPEESDTFANFVLGGMLLNMLGLGAMLVAFVTGTFAVLEHSLALAIATCVVASCVFLIHSALFTKLVIDVDKRPSTW